MKSSLKIIALIVFFVVIIAISTFGIFKDAKDKNTVTAAEVEKIVANYIQTHPQEIVDAVVKLQRGQDEETKKKSKESIKAKINDLENDPASPVAGNPQGDVTIVEFFDYSCGYCKKVFPTVLKLLDEDKNVKIVFKEFPILGPNSELASRAALAVHIIDPGKYFDFHKALMAGHVTGQETIDGMAKDLGIDVKAMTEKMHAPEVDQIIAKDRALASAINVRGTPAFVIGEEFVPGAIDIDGLKNLVKATRENKGKAPAEPAAKEEAPKAEAPAAAN